MAQRDIGRIESSRMIYATGSDRAYSGNYRLLILEFLSSLIEMTNTP